MAERDGAAFVAVIATALAVGPLVCTLAVLARAVRSAAADLTRPIPRAGPSGHYPSSGRGGSPGGAAPTSGPGRGPAGPDLLRSGVPRRPSPGSLLAGAAAIPDAPPPPPLDVRGGWLSGSA